MRKSTLKGTDKECFVYENFEEVTSAAHNPPRFCQKCGSEFRFYSFYDSLDRFTLKAVCPKCKNSFAVSLKEDTYEKHMLDHWKKFVKERAGYKCEMEDEKCNGDLHAHHIIPKHLDPSKKYDVTNGICLCEAHHKMIHHYM